MATIEKNFLDLTGLTSYDTAIKQWANSVNQIAFKSALTDANGDFLYLYKKPNAVLATDTPDATISLGGGNLSAKLTALAAACGAVWNQNTSEYDITLDSTFDQNTATIVAALNELKGQINILNGADTTNGSVAKSIKDAIGALDTSSDVTIASESSGVVTLKAGIKEEDGVIAQGTGSDIVLAKVATTGDAEDIAYDNTTSGLTATDAQAAIDELAEAVGDGVDSKTIYMTDNTSTIGTDYATIYKIYQGDTGSAASPAVAELIGTINIPKDQFVDEADLVDITYNSIDGKLYDGVNDVTELIKGAGGTATAADAGKYMKIVFAITSGTAAKSTIYISVKDLSHVYTGGSNTEVTVSIDSSTDVITATIGDIDGTKITYIAADAGTGTARESVTAALTRLDGSDSTTGSVAKKIKDAIGGLDTSSDVTVASYTAGTSGAADVITLTGSIKEEDGVIDEGTADTITLSNITATQIAGLFS